MFCQNKKTDLKADTIMKNFPFFHNCLTETQNEYLLWDLDTCILGLRKRAHSGLILMRSSTDFQSGLVHLEGTPGF